MKQYRAAIKEEVGSKEGLLTKAKILPKPTVVPAEHWS